MNLNDITNLLITDLEPLIFSSPVTHVYNPLVYARKPYNQYIRKYGKGHKEVVLFGMNPGPFGMAQTGVPFGVVELVRDWLGIKAKVDKPDNEHPKRPVLGFDCPRQEVSGARVWGWARDTFGEPEVFFKRFFVANYCPLCFMEESGRNFTPDKLNSRERELLLEVCDQALRRVIEHFQPKYVVGVGNFAESRANAALRDMNLIIGKIIHPSPANPNANKGWSQLATKGLRNLGIEVP